MEFDVFYFLASNPGITLRKKSEKIKECQEDFASVQELWSHIQGYVDCVQVLFRIGLLTSNSN